jgi:Flp pilus assembly pilin Flp
MRAWCAAAWKRDERQTLVEYSLILALVAAGLVALLILFRDSMGNSYEPVGNRVDRAGLQVASPGGGSTTSAGGSAGGGGGAGGASAKGDHSCGGGCGGERDR